MSEKKETTFSRLFHSKLSSWVYVEKMSNPWRRGTPDFYYESENSTLWSEHKWIERPWTETVKAENICNRKQWPLQRRWLTRAYHNGINVNVVVGVGSGKNTNVLLLNYPFNFDPAIYKLLSLEEAKTNLELILLQ